MDKEYYYNKCFGLHYKVFIRSILKLKNKLADDDGKNNQLIEEIHNKKEEIYLGNLNMINMHPFMLETLIENKDKKENKKYTALATTASPNGVYGILKEFNLNGLFDLILTGDDIENKKPDPEIFFKCMEHFKVSEKESIIFEDSRVGLEAANKTNAWVIKIEKWSVL